MATDLVAGIYAAIVTACADSGVAAAGVRRVVVYNGTDPYPVPTAVGVGELAEVVIDYEEGSDDPYVPLLHYGQNEHTVPANDNWREEGSHGFILTVTMPDVRIAAANSVCNAIKKAFRKAGPTFGLEYVTHWGPFTRNDELIDSGSDPNARGTMRRVCYLRCPFHTELNGNPELS